jgi:hypothetical protein
MLIGTKGAEAIVRASTRDFEMEGPVGQAVAHAWDTYAATKDADAATRKAASDDLDRALQALISRAKTRWVISAGVGVQRAALAVAVWDLPDKNGPFKLKHRDWLIRQWHALKLDQDLLPEG